VATHVRLSLVKPDDLFDEVQPRRLFTDSQILEAIKQQRNVGSVPYRQNAPFLLVKDVNLATLELGAQVKQLETSCGFVGTISLQLVEGTPSSGWTLWSNGVTNDRNLYTYHNINNAGSGVVVQLGAVYLLNRVQLHLYDDDQYSYCYYVEVKFTTSNSSK